MPKRNRHREAQKAAPRSRTPETPMKSATPTTKPAAPSAAKPAAPATLPVAPNASCTVESAPPAGPTKQKKKKDPPWVTTPPLTPEQRRAKNRLKRERNEAKFKLLRQEILTKLAEKWPAAFPADPTQLRPLAIGVHVRVIEELSAYPQRALRIALRKVTNSEAYLTLIAAGGQRYDLDGKLQGEITEGARAEAVKRLAEKRARQGGTA